MKIWDVDKFEKEIPLCMVEEWNEYLDYELETLTRAILGTIPAAKQIGGGGGDIKLTKPEDICGFFDAINKGN